MAKSVRTEVKIGSEVGPIEFFEIYAPNSDLHDCSELPNDEKLEFSSKMLCFKMEKIGEKVGLIEYSDMETACPGFSLLQILEQAI